MTSFSNDEPHDDGLADSDCDLDGPALSDGSGEAGDLGPELGENEVELNDVKLDILEGSPATAEGGMHFMPNCIPFAGLQHVVNNLCADTHKSLKLWPVFFGQLKNIEAFLNVPERRDRYCWTCLRHTRFAIYEPQFQRFCQTLYEERWCGFWHQMHTKMSDTHKYKTGKGP